MRPPGWRATARLTGDPSPGDPGTSPTDEPRADDVRVPLREGTLRLDRSSVELLSADAVASFRVFAHGAPVEVARVVARPGVRVSLRGGDTSFAARGWCPTIQAGVKRYLPETLLVIAREVDIGFSSSMIYACGWYLIPGARGMLSLGTTK